jgi:sugar lactone lactonase YvrE
LVQITQTGAYTYRALMQTAPTLAPGSYRGSFAVKVCRDAACVQHFPGSPMALPYDITVTPGALTTVTATPGASLDLTTNAGKAAPQPLSVRVGARGRTWKASTSAAWITLFDASGAGDGAFRVGYQVSALALGTQEAEIVIMASDGQRVVLPVRAQLLPVAFSVDRGQISFNAVNGAPIAAEAVTFRLADGAVTWSGVSDVPWLSLTPSSGATPGTTSLKVDPAAARLASGQYTGQMTLSAPGVHTSTVPVTLNLTRASLTASRSVVTLGGVYGRDQHESTLTLGLNTLANTHPWSLSNLPEWLAASPASGQVGGPGAAVALSAIANLAPGTSVASLTATVRVNGDTHSLPLTVTANRDVHRLLFSEAGVAMVATPGWSRLSRTVSVADNFDQSPAWSATSDKSWLSVTRSGSELTLRADPTGLPADTVSYATVSLHSPDATVSTAETLRVALWKGSATPGTITRLNKRYLHLKTDPIRPYLYANAGGSGIDVYNVYTTALVATIPGLGTALGEMSVSPDGATLFVYDTASAEVIVADLATLTKSATWPLANQVDHADTLLALRPNGVQLVWTRDGTVYTAGGRSLGGLGGMPRAVTGDGKRVFANGSTFDVDFSAMAGGTLFSKAMAPASAGDLAVSHDGKRLYALGGTPAGCTRLSTTDFSVVGTLPGVETYAANNIEVGSDGRVYCGISGWYSASDVWVYRADGVLLGSFKFAGYAEALVGGTMNISGDGMIVVGQTSDPVLAFVPVGPLAQ